MKLPWPAWLSCHWIIPFELDELVSVWINSQMLTYPHVHWQNLINNDRVSGRGLVGAVLLGALQGNVPHVVHRLRQVRPWYSPCLSLQSSWIWILTTPDSRRSPWRTCGWRCWAWWAEPPATPCSSDSQPTSYSPLTHPGANTGLPSEDFWEVFDQFLLGPVGRVKIMKHQKDHEANSNGLIIQFSFWRLPFSLTVKKTFCYDLLKGIVHQFFF